MLIFGGSWFSCFGVDVGDNAIDIAGVDENGIDVADAAGDLHLDFFPFLLPFSILHHSSTINILINFYPFIRIYDRKNYL